MQKEKRRTFLDALQESDNEHFIRGTFNEYATRLLYSVFSVENESIRNDIEVAVKEKDPLTAQAILYVKALLITNDFLNEELKYDD